MRPVLVLAAGLWLLLLAVFSLRGGADVRGAQTTIQAGNNYFCDPSFQGGVCERTINAGEAVTWRVVQGIHTVSECDESFSTCPPPGGFDSRDVRSGDSFSQTFGAAGTFEYRCNVHPSQMRGRIIVRAVVQPTVTPAPTTTTPPAAPTGASPAAAAPAAGAAEAAPAGVPRAGGPPGGGGHDIDPAFLVLAGGLLLLGSAGLGLRGMCVWR